MPETVVAPLPPSLPILPRKRLRPRVARAIRRRAHKLVWFLRRCVLGLIARVTPYVAVDHAGMLFVTSTKTRGVGRALFVRRSRPELILVGRAASVMREHGRNPEGSVLLDVGANIGTTTVAALVHHGFARALAIEPDPENVRLLETNVALNRLTGRVTVVEAAVSDTAGRAAFGRGAREGGCADGNGGLLQSANPGRERLEVEVTTVDAQLARWGIESAEVGALWIDAQGHDTRVLAGSGALTALGVPVIFAYRPGKLEEAGLDTIATLKGLVEHGYLWFVDLRHPTLYGSAWEPVLQSLASIESCAPARATDLLLLGAPVT